MKFLFHQPLGTVRRLGRPQHWLFDAIGLLIVLVAAMLAWIIL